MYSLSLYAIEQYRKGARQYKDLPIDVLKVRMNCLIKAAQSKRKTYSGMEYRFCACRIVVSHSDIITRIYWADRDTARCARADRWRLEYYYNKYGLNKIGTEFINMTDNVQ